MCSCWELSVFQLLVIQNSLWPRPRLETLLLGAATLAWWNAPVVHLAHPVPTWYVRRPSRPFWDWAVRATRNYFYTTHHALTAECSLILSGFGFADTSSDSPLISRAAKEMIEKRFGRIWHPDGAKKIEGLSLGSRGFQGSELRRTRRSKLPWATCQLTSTIWNNALLSDVFTASHSPVLPALRFFGLAPSPPPVSNHK